MSVPPPVGIMTKQSRPDMEALMVCFWLSRKVALPKKSLLALTMSVAQGKLLPAHRASEVPSTLLQRSGILALSGEHEACGASFDRHTLQQARPQWQWQLQDPVEDCKGRTAFA